jgi:outer membrane protein OmpA-like peptidoglycan-associated protein
MKLKSSLLILIFFISGFALAHSEGNGIRLKWDIPLNDRLEIVKTARVKYLLNTDKNTKYKLYDERNIIDLTCINKEERQNSVKGNFTIYQKDQGTKIFIMKEKYESEFIIEESGKFRIKRDIYMPNLRNIPSFPETNIRVGETWTQPAELVMTRYSVPFTISFQVNYMLTQMSRIAGDDVAVIEYDYQINENLTEQKVPDDFPAKILAANRGIIYWDINNNRPLDMKDNYRIIFAYPEQGSIMSEEFQMQILTENTVYPSVPKNEKEAMRDELKEAIGKDGIDVETEKRGLVVRMGDVLFDFDSYGLKENAKGKLKSLIETLKKKYPDREIIVEGHTDSIGEKDYNKQLSQNRAKSAAEYLKKGLGHDKISYKGFGADNPRVSNSTKEGREKNRRVEIIIKLD